MKKIGIIFGGRSLEHEISVLSASSVIGAIDRSKYEIVTIGINKSGDWFHITSDMEGILDLEDERFARLIPTGPEGTDGATAIHVGEIKDLVDFVFPVLHGPYGEDGTLQGLMEMLDMPYAGCGVASSAVSMDKIFAKELMVQAGLPSCKYHATYQYLLEKDRDAEISKIESCFPYPIIVKPANMGSSVGITIANDREELSTSIDKALKYDHRLLLEEFIFARELEIAVLGNEHPTTGAVGEIISGGEFYDYENKYQSDGTILDIPANIPEDVAGKIADLAVKLYKTLDASGFSRVDFFLEEGTGNIYINEMNTIPGFTAFSMFPLLMGKKGVQYDELIERIIDLGYERHIAKNSR